MSVCDNYRTVEEKVEAACRRAGRNRDEVTLIAVSKTKPVSMIEELLPIGVRDFGENKVQELTAKEETTTLPHMWPLSPRMPRSREAVLITLVDKICATAEAMHIWHCMRLRTLLPA